MAYLNESAQGNEVVWRDRKHWMWFPFSFTKYSIQDDRLFIERGFFHTISDETLLYRIVDIKLERTLAQKLFGTGTISLHVRVDVDSEVHLENIKQPQKIKLLLSHMVENSRDRRNVVGKEFYSSDRVHLSDESESAEGGMDPKDFGE